MEVILSLASGIIGAVIATWWTNSSIEQRDRAARKRYFLGFLEEWKMGFAPEVKGVNSEHYQRTVGSFCREARILQDDFPETKRTTFSELAKKASGFTGGQMDKSDRVRELITMIEEISRLVGNRDSKAA